ncbi:hypothetical protein H9P43_000986 [Blastocladiella emersonii ATCC 22665]|nr:hypothetical protein H9P43_000986 [Blastocladiella emersonii ATCC 22665]
MELPKIILPAAYAPASGRHDPSKEQVVAYAAALAAFIEKNQQFYNFHAVDFFVDGTFEDVCPEAWRGVVDNAAESEETFLGHVIELASNVQSKLDELESAWPASLLDFIRTSHSIGLPRDPHPLSIPRHEIDKNIGLGMTPKKVHEVSHLAAFISHVARSAGVANLVDLGAGQGYLSSVLALKYGHNVLGVDTDPIQTNGATRRRATLFKRLRHKLEDPGHLVYLNRHITAQDTFDGLVRAHAEAEAAAVDADNAALNHDEIPENLRNNERYMAHQRKRLRQTTDLDWTEGKWGLIGLHTCGDLSPITLRMWRDSTAALVINVGCCYNHISEPYEDKFEEDMLAPGTRDKFLKTRIINAPRGATTETDPSSAAAASAMWTTDGAAAAAAPTPMPLAPDAACSGAAGFPMSSAVAALDVHLGWTARMLACQSTCRWSTQGDAAAEAFRRHLYRALLQQWIHAAAGTSPVVAVHTAKTRRGHLPPFSVYARGAVEALARDHPDAEWTAALVEKTGMATDAELDAFHDESVKQGALKKIALVWTLRALMAEAIESLILVDRYLWIVEDGRGDAVLFPLFDHVDSPRNCVILGIKREE